MNYTNIKQMGKSKHTKKRSNGAGTLIKKASGIYQARWSYNGRCYYQSTGEKNYERALVVLEKIVKPYQEDSHIAVLENIQAQINTGKKKREIEKERSTTVMLSDIWSRFLEVDKKVRNAKPQTQSTYKRYINKLVDWLKEQGITDIKKVTETHAIEYRKKLLKEMCADSVKQRMSTYRWIWRSLTKVAYLKSNPWEGEDGDIYKVKVTQSGHRRLLTDEEVQNLLSQLNTDEERLLFGLAIYLGQRISDCACFKKSYINFKTNEVHFIPIKTKDCKDPEVYAVACPPLRALIDKVVAKGGDDDYLMPNFADRWRKQTLCYHIGKVFNKAGIKTSEIVDGKRQVITGFHALRIWWATKARDLGMPESVVQKIMCHRTEKMTEHYFRQNLSTIKEGLGKFVDYFGNTTAPRSDQTNAQNGADGANVSLPQGVSADELKTMFELLEKQKRDGESVVDCLKRLVAVKNDADTFLSEYKRAS